MPQIPLDIYNAVKDMLLRGGGVENRLIHLETLMAVLLSNIEKYMHGGKAGRPPEYFRYWEPQDDKEETANDGLMTPDQLAERWARGG